MSVSCLSSSVLSHILSSSVLSHIFRWPVQQFYGIVAVVMSILQIRKLGHRKVKYLAQCYTTSKWWCRNLNPSTPIPELTVLTSLYPWKRRDGKQHVTRYFCVRDVPKLCIQCSQKNLGRYFNVVSLSSLKALGRYALSSLEI